MFADTQFLTVLINNHDISRALEIGHQPWQDNANPPASPDRQTSLYHSSRPAHSDSLVVDGCVNVLRVFLFLWQRRKTVFVCHLAEQQALSAAIVLVMDTSQRGSQINIPLLEKAQLALIEMQRTGASRFGDLAFKRLSAGLKHVQTR